MKRSRNLWTADAEEVFVRLWQQKVDDLRGPRKNSHVYQEMAAEMQMQGYDVNSSSVKIKIDNLTAKYRKAKAGMGTTGGSPASWHSFEQVHQIIGGFSINNVEELIEESFEDSMSSSPTNISPLSPSLPQLSFISTSVRIGRGNTSSSSSYLAL
ncbi:myb/SANT-like DNA-binding domain-containing protein 1 [Rhagoletis pomonella]|uniref:myb/SANT-like DNA-binding domain-containing protein 1 n=1 Tax=Rhagoletis pomonella TaxID=28610 RepID=UPI0017807259|nr:myb/SANT-like DNA-binding domain-containing protein 1 [Rhagoletis pomonella]